MRQLLRFVVLTFTLVFACGTSAVALAQDQEEGEADDDQGDLIASINPGDCDLFDDTAAFELGDLDAPDADDPENETVGDIPDPQVWSDEEEQIEATYDELEEHVVAVIDLSAGEAVLACGPIAGVIHDGKLEVPLYSVEDGSLRGIAVIQESDDNEDTLDADVYFVPAPPAVPATPVATPIG